MVNSLVLKKALVFSSLFRGNGMNECVVFVFKEVSGSILLDPSGNKIMSTIFFSLELSNLRY